MNFDPLFHKYSPVFHHTDPLGVPTAENNIYFRTSKQLHDYLIENDFAECQVSRVNIGLTEYYNIKFDVPTSCNHSKHDYQRMKKLLGIKNIGLMDFSTIKKECGSIHHIVVVIDEKELNDKYLIDGDLVFNTLEREIKRLIIKTISSPTEITYENGCTDIEWDNEKMADIIYHKLKDGDYLK